MRNYSGGQNSGTQINVNRLSPAKTPGAARGEYERLSATMQPKGNQEELVAALNGDHCDSIRSPLTFKERKEILKRSKEFELMPKFIDKIGEGLDPQSSLYKYL